MRTNNRTTTARARKPFFPQIDVMPVDTKPCTGQSFGILPFKPDKGAFMGEVLKADLDAIRALAERQHGSASEVRGIDPAPAVAPVVNGLAGSDTASRCGEAAEKVAVALAEVAGRIDVLAQTNRQAADTIGLADETYAENISATLNHAP